MEFEFEFGFLTFSVNKVFFQQKKHTHRHFFLEFQTI